MSSSWPTVVLVGQKAAGKSSLLQTWVQCVTSKQHGFVDEGLLSANSITEKRFAEEDDRPPPLLSAVDGDYESFSAQFFSEQQETTQTTSYYFELNFGVRKPTRLCIVDSAGEHSIKSPDRNPSQPESVQAEVNKLSEALKSAHSVIVAVPLIDLHTSDYGSGLQQFINDLVIPTRPNPKRIVIAYTHYERLFVELGNSAKNYARNHKVIQHVIESATAANRWSQPFREFVRNPDREIFLTVSSAFGFVRDNGSPNVDPHAVEIGDLAPERPFLSPRGRFANWEPFLTADPFLCAALGKAGEFAIEFPRPAKAAPPPRTPSPPPPEREKNRRLQWLWNVTNTPD